MVIEDLVILGTTVPEPSKRSARTFVCSAGVSRELRQLIRVYPLAVREIPRRWHIYTVTLERSPHDSRIESWTIAGDRSERFHWRINQRFREEGKVPVGQRADLLESFRVDSIASANERRQSLALIHPLSRPVLEFTANAEHDEDSPEMELFSMPSLRQPVAKRFAYKPYLRFEDERGSHRLQLRDWGTYEFMRKHGDARRNELGDWLHLSDASSLLVGNMANRRNVWLVISVLGHVRAPERLFDIPSVSRFPTESVRIDGAY
jgi:hypothetical protein